MKARLLILVVLSAATGLGAWWWFFGGAEIPVTEAEARRYLDRMVEAAARRDFDALCRLNGSVLNCRRQLDVACDPIPFDPPKVSCKDTVPDELPTVASTRYSPKSSSDDTAGRILVVRGIDGAGKSYETEVFVFRENRYNFKAINSVYWSNAFIIEGEEISPEPPFGE